MILSVQSDGLKRLAGFAVEVYLPQEAVKW